MKRISVCLLLLQGLLLLSAAAQQKIKILTTFAPAYAFASNVAGTAATVENLLPPHASLHDYTLSPRDLRKLHSADILILNGAGLETWIAPALKTLESKPNLRILQLADGKELLKSHHHKHHEKEAEHHHHHHGDTNPHIWLDPIIAMECVGEIADFLANADPNNADLYRNNAANYIKRLQGLHDEYETKTAAIKNRAFLTYHNAFDYLARRYGLSLVGVVEKVPEIPPTSRELKHLHQLIKKEKVLALFVEPGSPNRVARQITRDAKIKLAELDPFESGELNFEAYEKVMRSNLEKLLATLQP